MAAQTGYVESKEFLEVIDALKVSLEDSYETLASMINRVVTRKYKNKMNHWELEELAQEVNFRVFKKISDIIKNPIEFFSRDGREHTEEYLGGCFHNYVIRIAENFIAKNHKKYLDTISIDDEEKGGFFEKLISNEKLIAIEIEDLDNTVSVYRLCMTCLFKLNSKPYVILAFCFNVLIYGDEAGHSERGCATRTVAEISDRKLGTLRDIFCEYHRKYLRPIPSDTICYLDAKLSAEHKNTPFTLHVMKSFYGKSGGEKSVSDWTYITRKALLKALLSDPMVVEFVEESL